MRIALVLEKFDRACGGKEQWTWQLAIELVKRGNEVHVIAKHFSDEASRIPAAFHRLENVRSRLGFAEAAQAAARSLKPDVVHDMGSGWFCDVFQPHGGSWCSVSERKLCTQPAWFRPLKRRVDFFLPRRAEWRALLQQQYAKENQTVVAVSRMVADDLIRFDKVRPEDICVVYNGVDTVRFSPHRRNEYRDIIRRQLGISGEGIVLLAVAHNFRLKGVPTLLRSMRLLGTEIRPIHLLVVGGKRLRHWHRVSKRLGIGSAVSLLGTMRDTLPFYAAADIFVHPTFYDPCSLVLLEAAASGLPLITTRHCNGVSELLTDGVDATFINDPSNPTEVAGRIRTLLDESVRAEMGRAARRMSLNHTFRQNVDEIIAAYEGAALVQRRAA